MMPVLGEDVAKATIALVRSSIIQPDFLTSLPGYVYAVRGDEVWVNLYAAGRGMVTLGDGRQIGIEQRTEYPWDGEIGLAVDGAGSFGLCLRIPAWCDSGARLTVNDEPVAAGLQPGTYADPRRDWGPGDIVRLSLPMPARRIETHPNVTNDHGRVALMRGPILYRVEAADHPGVDVRDFVLPATATFDAWFEPDLLGGIVTLTTRALAAPPDSGWTGKLYRPATAARTAATTAVTMTAVPYRVWANREPGPMRVWPRATP